MAGNTGKVGIRLGAMLFFMSQWAVGMDRVGFLTINVLVSYWKWNNKWAFRALSGQFHAWLFSLSFSVNPLGKQRGMAVRRGGSRERQNRTGNMKWKDQEGKEEVIRCRGETSMETKSVRIWVVAMWRELPRGDRLREGGSTCWEEGDGAEELIRIPRRVDR